MKATKEETYHAALQLSDADRAELAQRLLDSLPDGYDALADQDPAVRQEWLTEIRRRARELDRGEVERIPGEQVHAELRAKYRK